MLAVEADVAVGRNCNFFRSWVLPMMDETFNYPHVIDILVHEKLEIPYPHSTIDFRHISLVRKDSSGRVLENCIGKVALESGKI